MPLVNNGYLAYSILEGIYLDDASLDGMIMPNIQMISPEAIVPDGTPITFNIYSNIYPTGGSNGNIWYNLPEDGLYINILGVWTLLTDRVLNTWYIPPIFNTGTCPIGASGASGS